MHIALFHLKLCRPNGFTCHELIMKNWNILQEMQVDFEL